MSPGKLATLLLVGLFFAPSGLGAQQFDWEKARREIKRLPPAAFKQLPKRIVKELERRECAIPQTYYPKPPNNVIQGEFAHKGQQDWAVLCSREEKSSILIFWGEPNDCPDELANSKDWGYLQHIGDDKIAYSRAILPASPETILRSRKIYGGPEPPPLDHQGISDAFLEKGSGIYYCYEGKWLLLTGSD